MANPECKEAELHLKVYKTKSVLVNEDASETFLEGPLSKQAQIRLSKIRVALREGFLEKKIIAIRGGKILNIQNENHRTLVEDLVNAITSEVGRALIGVTILQCCIKAIEPEQSIRLHKANSKVDGFSWQEGVPMRSIDKELITPILRKHDLLHLNADGFMMTRSLAENYPYTRVYKAALRGAREQWLEIVDNIEQGKMDAHETLDHILSLLVNKSDEFHREADRTIKITDVFINRGIVDAVDVIASFVKQTAYSARVFEVAIHSFMQVLAQGGYMTDGFLKPLTQMRSANKKHGNIGDVEIVEAPNTPLIIEAWDAKYGKPYLRDEIEELVEKLQQHPETRVVGFIVDRDPELRPDIATRVAEISEEFGVTIHIVNFADWVKEMCDEYGVQSEVLAGDWLRAFAESLCQKRRDIAPIDEPSFAWVKDLGDYLSR